MAREKWNNRFAFLFTTVGSAVGLGNVWRFPYLCYKNGGGAFLIPYFVTLFFIALPQLILQTSLGQFTSRSATKAWDIVPIMKGLGIAVTVYAFLSNVTYATILAWALRYLYASFSPVLPWTTCDNPWNTPNCYTSDVNGLHFAENSTFNLVNGTNITDLGAVSSIQEFWQHAVLNISGGLTEVGKIQSEIAICLVLTWIVSFLCMFRGVNWTSKITYVTATLPIILLFVLLIRGLTLDGAMNGISYFLTIKPHKLLVPQVWKDAALQNIFSLSLGSGAMIALGSFNKQNDNFYRDSLILSLVNSCASILSGFTVFSTLGFMAKQQNTTVDEVAESGPGLAFTAYPQAVSMMPLSQLWSATFFIMLFLLGLDTLFVSIEALVAAVSDLAPRFFEKRWKKAGLNFMISMTLLLLGLPTVTQGGMYYIYLLDNYSSTSWACLFVVACECFAIAWLFGNERYYEEFCKMLQYKPRFPWFKFCWRYITPPTTMILFVYCLAQYKPLIYNRTYAYPSWAIAVGWILSLSGFLWIPGYVIYFLYKKKCRNDDKIYLEANLEEMKKDLEEEKF